MVSAVLNEPVLAAPGKAQSLASPTRSFLDVVTCLEFVLKTLKKLHDALKPIVGASNNDSVRQRLLARVRYYNKRHQSLCSELQMLTDLSVFRIKESQAVLDYDMSDW